MVARAVIAMGDTDTTLTINSDDILFIERISECRFSDNLKSCLLALFGEDGERKRVHDYQRYAYASCKHQGSCDDCGTCVPYREEPLILQIAAMVEAYLEGNLDLSTGEIMVPGAEPCPYF
jgi:hypothetical protein